MKLSMLQKFFHIFIIKAFLFSGHLHSQSPYFTPRGEQVSLTKEQKLAVLWFSSFSDSLKIDSAFNKSSIPFNWDGDSIYTTRVELKNKFKQTKKCPDSIDTVFNLPDSARKYFRKSTQSAFDVIQIEYFICNNLRTHIILIAVDSNKYEVIGFYWIGSILSRRKNRSE